MTYIVLSLVPRAYPVELHRNSPPAMGVAVTWDEANGLRDWESALPLYRELLQFDRIVTFEKPGASLARIIAHDALQADGGATQRGEAKISAKPLAARTLNVAAGLDGVTLGQLAAALGRSPNNGNGVAAALRWRAYAGLLGLAAGILESAKTGHAARAAARDIGDDIEVLALRYFRLAKLHCLDEVEVLREVYVRGCESGSVAYVADGQRVEMEVKW